MTVKTQSFTFEMVAIIHSCYKEKFAIPRQSNLVANAQAEIELLPPYDHENMLKGLDGFSHIWISFVFHQHINKGFNQLVSPPRLQGSEKFGVYATRSPYRPNPIGLSVVKLEQIISRDKQLFLLVSGGDFLDQTPVIDIKPYIEYADSLQDTKKGWVKGIAAPDFEISFSDKALQQILQAEKNIPDMSQFIMQLLKQDPRPHYTKSFKNDYFCKVYQYDLHWQINKNMIIVKSLDFLKKID